MANSLRQCYNFLILSLLSTFLLLFSISNAQTTTSSFRPKALVLKVTKDPSTNQYLTTIPLGTPRFSAKLTLDLGGEFMWVDCESAFNSSSTLRPVPCRSARCSLSGSKICTAAGTCDQSPHNTVINFITNGNLSTDSAEFQSTAGRPAEVRDLIFTCTRAFLLEGLAGGSSGMAGLGRSRVSLPSLLSAAFSFPRRFSVCLGPTAAREGFIVFGDVEISETLAQTPLILNARDGLLGRPSPEYFVGVKSIRVNGKAVPVNASLLSFDENGHGGAKISTVHAHTVMETSVHDAVVAAFSASVTAPPVAAVAPFSACFGADDVAEAAPAIELVLEGEKRAVWRIDGPGSMVRVSADVACLGIVDGGPLGFRSFGAKVTQATVVIGGRQIEDRLLRFDLASSRLGFSSSLSSCSSLAKYV